MDRKNLDFDLIDERVQEAVEYVFQTAQHLEDAQGYEHSSVFLSSFLAAVITNLVVVTLDSCPDELMDSEERNEFATTNFQHLKQEIENVVGFSFRKGMKIFSGQHIDYYCEISLMPDAVNKNPC